MEMANITTKSLLKKTSSRDSNKTKKVTFNNTVKCFIHDRNKIPKIDNANLRCIEISIVDKSNGGSTSDSFDECKESDFLVHKVIYDNYVLPENDEDLDFKHDAVEEESEVFQSVPDEGLDFVVHKVTEHEDDLIKQDSDFHLENREENENAPILDLEESKMTEKFSKLSIENILEHDKIIAFIDQRSLCLSSVNNTPTTERISKSGFLENNDFFSSNSSGKLGNNLVLSPPLQELSLEKIVKAHSNNILCELDISPLNSVQETDSDSDLSSEGTMIMMTSEECQKNEEHIRESLLQYQSLKEKKESGSQSSDSDSDNSNVTVPQPIEVPLEVSESQTAELETSLETNESPAIQCTDLKTEAVSNLSGNDSSTSLPSDMPIKRTYSSSLPDATILYAKDNHSETRHHNVLKRASSENGTNFKGKYSVSVEIPSDVREWKILVNSPEKRSSRDTNCNQHNGASDKYTLASNQQSNGYVDAHHEYYKEYMHVPNEHSKEHLDVSNWQSKQYSDVPNGYSKQYLDVPNGYSKQYSDVHNDYQKQSAIYHEEPIQHISNDHPHAEKVCAQEKSYQDMNNTSVSQVENGHVPRSDELEHFVNESNERVERIRKRYHLNGKHHSRHGSSKQSPVRGIRPRFGSTAEILQLMQKQNNPPFITFSGTKNHMSWPCEETSSNPELDRTRLAKHSHYYVSQSLSSECSSQSSIDSYCEDPLNTSCDYSISSCPSIMVHERGTPEGASPPNFELAADVQCTSENPNGFVYFSMKV